jgi:hypothetical protein
MQIVYIMQGPPGGGKSHMARLISWNHSQGNCEIVSADDYFVNSQTGEYKFDAKKLGLAHAECFRSFKECIMEGLCVVVDNTNIQAWQAQQYVAFALEKNVKVVFIRVDGHFPNTHGVPQQTVERMRNSMETLTVQSVMDAKRPF